MADTERKRMEIRLDPATEQRLERLVEKLELPRTTVIRVALRQMAEREGVEDVKRAA